MVLQADPDSRGAWSRD